MYNNIQIIKTWDPPRIFTVSQPMEIQIVKISFLQTTIILNQIPLNLKN